MNNIISKAFQYVKNWNQYAFCLLLILSGQLANAQLFIANQAELFIETNGVMAINGDTQIENGGTLTMNGQEISIAGDLIQNGDFPNQNGRLIFTGTGVQAISGDLLGTNAPFDLVIEQGDNNSSINLQTNMEVDHSLEFVSGRITTNINEVYVKNNDIDAITGHFLPNVTDGTYPSNDRFVEGNLGREVTFDNHYIFPIGNVTDGYNPIQLENLSNNSGKITANFTTQTLGPIDFSEEVDCLNNNPPYTGSASNIIQANSLNQNVEYNAMTGEGFWEINSATSFDYEVIAYPNNANSNINPSNTDIYRLLKRPSNEAPSTDWTAAASTGNPCIHSGNYHEVVGTGFNGFSIFGVTSGATSLLPVELADFSLQNVNQQYFRLNWRTISENKNEGFKIERSEDGNEFETIGFIQGAGDSKTELHYFFDDKAVQKNIRYYYRLKQLDWDGHFSYSNILTGELTADFFMSELFPNPSKSHSYITCQTEVPQPLHITLFSITGQKIMEMEKRLEAGTNKIEMDVAMLPKGIYKIVFKTTQASTIRTLIK